MSITQSHLSSLISAGLIQPASSSEPPTNETKTYDAIAVVEIPQGSLLKYEVDKQDSTLIVDRVLNQPVPYNYGFIPGTLCDDGDPLDVFVLGDIPIHPLSKVKIQIVGALKCNDNGIGDDKLIAVIDGDTNNAWKVGTGFGLIQVYLTSYKFGFSVLDQLDRDGALKLYKEAQEMHTKDCMAKNKVAMEKPGVHTNEQDSGA